jgi:CO/xanthine dehydrogenase Mo-binding subunit
MGTYGVPMTVVGTRITRVEDRRLLVGAGTYVDNLREPELIGAAFAVFVRSPYASARITNIDTSRARAAAGVLAVCTAGGTRESQPRHRRDGAAMPGEGGRAVRW